MVFALPVSMPQSAIVLFKLVSGNYVTQGLAVSMPQSAIVLFKHANGIVLAYEGRFNASIGDRAI